MNEFVKNAANDFRNVIHATRVMGSDERADGAVKNNTSIRESQLG